MVKDKIAQIIQAREHLAQQVPDPTPVLAGSLMKRMIRCNIYPMDLPLIQRQTDAEGLDYFEVPITFTEIAMNDRNTVWLAPPFGQGELKEVEAKPEILVPLMNAGWSQCEPAAAEEVKTDIHD